MKKTVIGVIGCGVISNTYLRDLKRLCPELTVKAVADTIPEAAARQKEAFDIPVGCTPEELLADPEIEIVVNLTPPMLHTKVNRQVLEAGKHLFCEKPFALTMEDAEATVALAKEKGLVIGCAPDSFLGSSLTTCKKLIDDGRIGKPLYICMNMMSCGVETWHPKPENFYREGGGPIYDMGGYYFSALVTMFGPVESVFALGGKGFEERIIYTPERFGTTFPVEVPTHYSALLKLKNGMIVNANFSFDIWKNNMPMFEVYGTEGTLEVPDPNMHGGTPRLYRKEQTLAAAFGGEDPAGGDSWPVPELAQNVGTYVRFLGVKDLAAAIREGRPPRVNTGLALHVTEIMISVMESARTGEKITLDTSYDPDTYTEGDIK